MVYDSIGTLMTNVGLFGGGMLFGILGLIMAITRGMTKNSEKWAITFALFAWIIALAIPNTVWAVGVFAAGSVALIFALMPIMTKMEDVNIFVIAVIALCLNLIMVIGAGGFQESLYWMDNLGEAQQDIAELLGTSNSAFDGAVPEHGLCRPDDPSCSSSAIAGAFNPLIYDVFASVLTIGDYIAKAIKLAGAAVFAPFVISAYIRTHITNFVVWFLISVLMVLFNFAIIYKVIAFVLNKRGMT